MAGHIDIRLISIGSKQVCVVQVPRSARPIYMSGGKEQREFVIRSGTTTQSLDIEQANEYIRSHWG